MSKKTRTKCKYCISDWHGFSPCISGPPIKEGFKKPVVTYRNRVGYKWVVYHTDRHLCRCGCLEYITVLPNHRKKSVGIPSYRPGHWTRTRWKNR